MSETRIPPKPGGPKSRFEYVEVTIGNVKTYTTKAMAERFIKQMQKQDERFFNSVKFVEPPPKTKP